MTSLHWGIIKKLGQTSTIPRVRFDQFMIMVIQPHELLKQKMIGYVDAGTFWIVCHGEKGEMFMRVPFARNRLWFDALTSEDEFLCIRGLPQMYLI
jgi:hypothetical protein